jgi:hypothetical protein
VPPRRHVLRWDGSHAPSSSYKSNHRCLSATLAFLPPRRSQIPSVPLSPSFSSLLHAPEGHRRQLTVAPLSWLLAHILEDSKVFSASSAPSVVKESRRDQLQQQPRLLFISGLRPIPTGPVLFRPRQSLFRPPGEPVLLFPLFHFCFMSSLSLFYLPEVDSAMNESFRACTRRRPILSDSEGSSSTPRRPHCLVPALLCLQRRPLHRSAWLAASLLVFISVRNCCLHPSDLGAAGSNNVASYVQQDLFIA